MDLFQNTRIALMHIFTELDILYPYSLDFIGYIDRIKVQCNKFITIIDKQQEEIYKQQEEIEQKYKEIQLLKQEIEFVNTTIFTTINRDIIHMRKILDNSHETKKSKFVEKLYT